MTQTDLHILLTSALDGMGDQSRAPADLPPGVHSPGTDCGGRWLGTRVSKRENDSPHMSFNPRPSTTWRVATPTTLTRAPFYDNYEIIIILILLLIKGCQENNCSRDEIYEKNSRIHLGQITKQIHTLQRN